MKSIKHAALMVTLTAGTLLLATMVGATDGVQFNGSGGYYDGSVDANGDDAYDHSQDESGNDPYDHSRDDNGEDPYDHSRDENGDEVYDHNYPNTGNSPSDDGADGSRDTNGASDDAEADTPDPDAAENGDTRDENAG